MCPMEKNTFETYLIEIKAKYDIEKKGDHSTFLNNPTPASIRNLCVEIFKSSKSNIDNGILKHFFDLKGDEKDKSIIEKFDIDKFRPICHFYKGKTETPKYDIVDLMALLVDLDSRPLSKYLKEGSKQQFESEKEAQEEEFDGKSIVGFSNSETTVDKPKSSIWVMKNLKGILLGCLVVLLLFLGMNYFFKEEECMQWQKDHYVLVDCDAVEENNYDFGDVIPVDQNQLTLKKIEVCDTTPFFIGKKALVYYCKINDKPQYFNHRGYHPLSGQELRRITSHIIEAYVEKCK